MIYIFGSLIMALLIGMLSGFITDLTTSIYRIKEIVIVVTILAFFLGLFVTNEYCKQEIQKFEALKYTIEESVDNENLSGFEKLELVKQANELNSNIVGFQYMNSRWYGKFITNDIDNVELISFDKE